LKRKVLLVVPVVAALVVLLVSLMVASSIFAGEPADVPAWVQQATYLGSTTCLNCHNGTVAEDKRGWHGTLHAKMIQGPEGNIADWSTVGTVTTTWTLDDVVYTIGSKYRQRYVFRDTDGTLKTMAVQWNVATRQWVPAAVEDWLNGCGGCHTTGYNADTKTFVEVSIGCEECHGPGSLHPGVAFTNPPGQRNIFREPDQQVCGACHNRGTDPETGRAWDVGYTPGVTLTFTTVPTTTTTRWWQDPYYHAKGHRQQYPEWERSGHARSLAPTALPFFRDACLECHSEDYRTALRREEIPPTKAEAKYPVNCVSCHETHERGLGGNQLREPLAELEEYLPCSQCHDSRNPLPAPAESAAVAELELCGQCHNAENPGLINTGSLHHPMIEAFTGGSYEIFGLSQPVPSVMHQAGVVCVNCHMPNTAQSAIQWDIATHIWTPITPTNSITGPAAGIPNACTNGGCHGGSDADADLQKILDIRQARIKRDLGILQARLEAASAFSQTTKYKIAYTAHSFVNAEGSYGLHNYDYTNALLAAANTALGFPNTLEAVKVNTPPSLDGDPSDAAWAAAPELDIGALDVKMKAVYTDQDLYLLVTWRDPTASFTRGGAWTWDGSQWGHTSGQSEDRVTIMWDKDTPDFDQRGCSTKCHPGSHNPGGEDDAWLTSGKADLWHMKAARSLPAISASQTGLLTVDPQTHEVTAGTVTFRGYVDDTWVGQWSATNPDGGRYGDAGRSSYSNNSNADATAPRYIETAPADFVDAMTLYQSEIDAGEAVEVAGLTPEQLNTYWANYAALNAVVPERILRLPTDSRADVLQAATWEDGRWTLEFKRALNTGHPDDDTIFDDLGKAYGFGVATMDNSGGEAHVTSGLYKLVFRYKLYLPLVMKGASQ